MIIIVILCCNLLFEVLICYLRQQNYKKLIHQITNCHVGWLLQSLTMNSTRCTTARVRPPPSSLLDKFSQPPSYASTATKIAQHYHYKTKSTIKLESQYIKFEVSSKSTFAIFTEGWCWWLMSMIMAGWWLATSATMVLSGCEVVLELVDCEGRRQQSW